MGLVVVVVLGLVVVVDGLVVVVLGLVVVVGGLVVVLGLVVLGLVVLGLVVSGLAVVDVAGALVVEVAAGLVELVPGAVVVVAPGAGRVPLFCDPESPGGTAVPEDVAVGWVLGAVLFGVGAVLAEGWAAFGRLVDVGVCRGALLLVGLGELRLRLRLGGLGLRVRLGRVDARVVRFGVVGFVFAAVVFTGADRRPWCRFPPFAVAPPAVTLRRDEVWSRPI